MTKTCGRCEGTGGVPCPFDGSAVECPVCQGGGEVVATLDPGDDAVAASKADAAWLGQVKGDLHQRHSDSEFIAAIARAQVAQVVLLEQILWALAGKAGA